MAEPFNTTNWYRISDHAVSCELGKTLRYLRVQQNLTQEQLGEKAGLSRSAISEMENGKTATSLLTVIQVLRALQQLHVLDNWLNTEEPASPENSRPVTGERYRASRIIGYYSKRKREEDESDWLL
jgi:transcriptional regulator with XRE-family HTH domain